jgi:hypothetical protein
MVMFKIGKEERKEKNWGFLDLPMTNSENGAVLKLCLNNLPIQSAWFNNKF